MSALSIKDRKALAKSNFANLICQNTSISMWTNAWPSPSAEVITKHLIFARCFRWLWSSWDRLSAHVKEHVIKWLLSAKTKALFSNFFDIVEWQVLWWDCQEKSQWFFCLLLIQKISIKIWCASKEIVRKSSHLLPFQVLCWVLWLLLSGEGWCDSFADPGVFSQNLSILPEWGWNLCTPEVVCLHERLLFALGHFLCSWQSPDDLPGNTRCIPFQKVTMLPLSLLWSSVATLCPHDATPQHKSSCRSHFEWHLTHIAFKWMNTHQISWHQNNWHPLCFHQEWDPFHCLAHIGVIALNRF